MIEVYHRCEIWDMVSDLCSVPYEHVATVQSPFSLNAASAFEYAYRWTNNVEGSWSSDDKTDNHDYNPDVIVRQPLHIHNGKQYGLRSSSVGDLFLYDGKMYLCDRIGFTLFG